MRDQEEIALRVSREQEREIGELQQQVASAKEEVRKTKYILHIRSFPFISCFF